MSKQILLAHEDATASRAITRTFERAGAEITQVRSARDALDALRSTTFNGLVCSPSLEEIDCWRLVRMIRTGRICPPTLPVALLTANSAEATHYGSTAYDLKVQVVQGPLDLDIATSTLDWLMETGRPSALIIEDDALAANLAERALKDVYDVDVAYDGRTGLEQWKTKRHQLVVLDVRLPGLSGPEVLKDIRAIDSNQPVIVLTGYASDEQHEALMLSGAWDFLGKPFDVHDLQATCEMALRHHNATMPCPGHSLNVSRRVAYQVQAADAAIGSGQTGKAQLHLRRALEDLSQVDEDTSPSDDQWFSLMEETNPYANSASIKLIVENETKPL